MSNGSEHLPEYERPPVRVEIPGGHTARGHWVAEPGGLSARFEGALICGPHDEHGVHIGRRARWVAHVKATLALRWMDITETEIRAGIDILSDHGFHGDDAQAALEAFLLRLTPYWRLGHADEDDPATPVIERFPGWPAIRALIRAESTTSADLARRWGAHSALVAAVLVS